MLNIISLGAGVQSSTMALMAAAGEIMPMPDGAIFADTQSEPAAVYRHLGWLEKQLPFPVYQVTAGSLRDEIIGAMNGTNRMDARPPFFIQSGGMLNRQCTQDFKIRPIEKQLGALIGHQPRARWPKEPAVTQWIGISEDEVQRAKPSRNAWAIHRWPLIELGMTRADCSAWCVAHDFPIPPKSACTFCPYHDDALWRDMKARDPESFADAITVDEAIRPGMPGPRRPKLEQWFLHRSRIPLAKIDFRTAQDAGQATMFDEQGFAVECEGMCGV
jgi:hypothetical protein